MDAQVIKTNSDLPGDHYSETGNSWNQEDVDEAYRKYYSNMPAHFDDEGTQEAAFLELIGSFSAPPSVLSSVPKVKKSSESGDSAQK